MAAYTGRPGVDWDTVARFVGLEREAQDSAARQRNADQLLAERTRLAEESAKQNAIRWQGQQDYQTLIDSGVDPAEALRRTSHKLFFNNPAGQAAIVRATKPTVEKPAWTPTRGEVEGRGFGMTSPNSAIWDRPVTAPTTKTPTPLNERDRLSLMARIPSLVKSAEGFDKESPQYQSATNAISRIEAALAPTPRPGVETAPPSVDEFAGWEQPIPQDELPSAAASDIPATAENAEMLTRRNAPMLAPVAAAPPVSSGNEVIRLTKDGRKAVFDAATKKFIRYAD